MLPGSGLSGGIRTFVEMAKRLAPKGHEISVVFPKAPTGDYEWSCATFHPKKTVFTDIIDKALERFLPEGAFQELQSVRMEKAIPECDVNFASAFPTAFPVYRSGRGLPHYHIQHYEPLFVENPRMKRIAEETYTLPMVKITNSSWLQKTIEEKTGVRPHLVNHGLDHSVFYPRDVEREGVKKKVVAFGKDVVWKGVPDLLDAMEIVMKERNDVELVLFGPKPLPYAKDGVPYRFLPGISDEELTKLYSSADAVACPSWYESFPLPPLEAMACGAPMVTTRIGTEDYAIDEDTALVVPPREPKAMANAILRLLEDESLRERLRKNGMARAKEFTWDRTAEGIDSILRKGVQ